MLGVSRDLREIPSPNETAGEERVETVRPKLPPTVDEMLDEIKPRLPTLDDEALRVVLTFFTGYVGNDDIPVVKVDQETALTELELTHGWKKKDITAACEQLMQDLADVLGRLNEEFEEATGSEVRTADFEIFKKRYAEERQEQAALVTWANGLLDTVAHVSGILGIQNPDAGPSKKGKGSPQWIRKFAKTAKTVGKMGAELFVRPEGEVMPEGEESASWLSEPVLTKSDRDIRTLDMIVKRLSSGGASVSTELHWSHFERLSLNRSNMTELFGRVAQKAREQLTQSAKVIENVTAEHREFSERLGAVEDVRQINLAVNDFLS